MHSSCRDSTVHLTVQQRSLEQQKKEKLERRDDEKNDIKTFNVSSNVKKYLNFNFFQVDKST